MSFDNTDQKFKEKYPDFSQNPPLEMPEKPAHNRTEIF